MITDNLSEKVLGRAIGTLWPGDDAVGDAKSRVSQPLLRPSCIRMHSGLLEGESTSPFTFKMSSAISSLQVMVVVACGRLPPFDSVQARMGNKNKTRVRRLA